MDSKWGCIHRGLMLIWRMSALKRIDFDWDEGNLEHATKHGVARSEIEQVFRNDPMIVPDPYPDSRRKEVVAWFSDTKFTDHTMKDRSKHQK